MEGRHGVEARGFSPLVLTLMLVLTGASTPLPAVLAAEADAEEDTRSLTVAVAQFAIASDIAGNLRAYIEQAREQGADIVLFSECCLSGYAGLEIESTDEIDREALAGAEEELRRCAQEADLFIAYGTTTFQPEGKPLNSLVLVNDEGAEVARYHKIFVTPGDQKHYAGGDTLVLADVRGVKVGLSICFDFRFPELYRWQAEQGAEVLLIAFHQCTDAGNPVLSEVGPAHLASRAAENNCFVVASNKGAPKQWFSGRIYAPNGTLVSAAPPDEEHLLLESLEMKQRNDWNARIARYGLRALRTGQLPCGRTVRP